MDLRIFFATGRLRKCCSCIKTSISSTTGHGKGVQGTIWCCIPVAKGVAMQARMGTPNFDVSLGGLLVTLAAF